MKNTFLSLLLLFSTNSQTEAGADDPNFAEARGQPNPTGSFNSCRAKIAVSDKNRDDFLTVEEYVSFCNRLSTGSWENFEELPQTLKDNYNEHVTASKGAIEIYGSKPMQRDASTAQLDFLKHFCSNAKEAFQEVQTSQETNKRDANNENECNGEGGGDSKVADEGESILLTIRSSFIISNEVGLSADILVSGANRRRLQKAYKDFARELNCCSSTNNVFCKETVISEYHHQVHFSVDSPEVYQIIESDCSNTTTSANPNALCQTVFARYVLEVFKIDPDHVYDEYVSATSEAIDDGLLQMHLAREGSKFVVEKSSEPVYNSHSVVTMAAATTAPQGKIGETARHGQAGAVAAAVTLPLVTLVAAGCYCLLRFRKGRNDKGKKKIDKPTHKKDATRENECTSSKIGSDHSDDFESYGYDEPEEASERTQHRRSNDEKDSNENSCNFANDGTTDDHSNEGSFQAPPGIAGRDELDPAVSIRASATKEQATAFIDSGSEDGYRSEGGVESEVNTFPDTSRWQEGNTDKAFLTNILQMEDDDDSSSDFSFTFALQEFEQQQSENSRSQEGNCFRVFMTNTGEMKDEEDGSSDFSGALAMQAFEQQRGENRDESVIANDEAVAKLIQQEEEEHQKQKEKEESFNSALAQTLQEQEDQCRKKADPKKEQHEMISSASGKAVLAVQRIIQLVQYVKTNHPQYSTLAKYLDAVAIDDMVYMAEKILNRQEEFTTQDFPSYIDVGYHYTDPSNMNDIRSNGLLTKSERETQKVNSAHYNGSVFGDGVYTANNPRSFSTYGGVGLLVGRLQGNTERAAGSLGRLSSLQGPTHTIIGDKTAQSVRNWPKTDLYHEIVLQSSNQCLPMVKYDTVMLRQPRGEKCIQYLETSLQGILDELFNNNDNKGSQGFSTSTIVGTTKEVRRMLSVPRLNPVVDSVMQMASLKRAGWSPNPAF